MWEPCQSASVTCHLDPQSETCFLLTGLLTRQAFPQETALVAMATLIVVSAQGRENGEVVWCGKRKKC